MCGLEGKNAMREQRKGDSGRTKKIVREREKKRDKKERAYYERADTWDMVRRIVGKKGRQIHIKKSECGG